MRMDKDYDFVVRHPHEAAKRLKALEVERDGLQIDIVNLKGDIASLREALEEIAGDAHTALEQEGGE